MTTTAGTSAPSSPIPSTASTLWSYLLNPHGPSKANATQPHSYAQLTPQDKAGTSTRILLHDTHARLEKFSERANSMFSEIEASKREMVRVREEVESAREKELDTIAQLINRCQSSLQKTIGEPLQAREAATMQASLTVITERLRASEERIYSKLDALTALLQTQNQLSQSLQEQFSLTQTQQSRVLELLAPLHPMLKSVPLHIDIARNAILEKILEGCRCQCIDYCSGRSVPPAVTSCGTPSENAEPPVEARKRRRTGLDISNPGPNDPPVRRYRYEDQPIAVEERHALHGFARKPGEASTSAQPLQKGATLSAVQAPSGGKSCNEAVSRGHLLRPGQPGLMSGKCGIAPLATRLAIVSRDNENYKISSKVPASAVPGKRFIPCDDDDDDDDDL